MFHIDILMPYLEPCIDQIFSLFSANTAGGKKKSQSISVNLIEILCAEL